jgi:hypothetical protein
MLYKKKGSYAPEKHIIENDPVSQLLVEIYNEKKTPVQKESGDAPAGKSKLGGTQKKPDGPKMETKQSVLDQG